MRQGTTFLSQSDADTLSTLQQHPTAIEPGFPPGCGAFTIGLMAAKES
jgi:hypothetical protein